MPESGQDQAPQPKPALKTSIIPAHQRLVNQASERLSAAGITDPLTLNQESRREAAGKIWYRRLKNRFSEHTQKSERDSLTELYNQDGLHRRLDEHIGRASRSNMPLAVLFLDTNDFKSINDSLGHPAGDLHLKKIGKTLVEAFRSTDTVARWGGDEFCIVLENMGKQSTLSKWDEVKKILEENGISMSAGLAVTHHDDVASIKNKTGIRSLRETLFKQADAAETKAKRLSKNGGGAMPIVDYDSITPEELTTFKSEKF